MSGKFCPNTGKTQGILFAQVVNSLILKVRDIAIFAAKISIFFQKLDESAESCVAFCGCNSHKLCKLAQVKFAVGQGKQGISKYILSGYPVRSTAQIIASFLPGVPFL